jgi:cytochrome c-type biogenesis protein CcmH
MDAPIRGRARPHRLGPLVVSVLLVLVALTAADPAAGAAEARRIAGELRCPVCQGLSVADSPTALAEQMRAVIRRKLDAGESRQEIVAYFVERYGEEVRLVPSRRGIGWALWLGPVVILGVAAAAGVLTLRRWRRGAGAPEPLTAEEERALRSLAGGSGA